MMLIDSHCHLDHQDFQDEVDAILLRARRAGVSAMLSIGTTLEGFPRVLEIAKRERDVFCTVGVHPHDAATHEGLQPDRLVQFSREPKVVGIGECGLDYHYNMSPQHLQVATFNAHIIAARGSGLPLVVHSRDADDEMASILENEASIGPVAGVLHCFTSGRALAEKALALGFYISFSGILTFKKSEELREIAAAVPADRLLIETDAPYLAPVPMRGRRNEPSFIAHTLRALAACRGEDEGQLAEMSSANFFRLFPKAARGEAR